MTEIRLLTETDTALLSEAFLWQNESPAWFQQSQAVEKETLEDFLDSAKDKLFYGIFNDDLTAVIRLTPEHSKVFSIDLFAKRGTPLDVLIQAGLSTKEYLFDKGIANGFCGWIPRINRGVRKLYAAIGFSHYGLICYRGKAHGKPVKWMYYETQNS